jgi:hypothetical protein
MADNVFQLAWQQFTVVSLFVRQAVRPLLVVFGSATIKLINAGLKTSIGGSLKLLSLYNAFLLFLALCCCKITSNFLINKLYAKGYFPTLVKHVTKTF